MASQQQGAKQQATAWAPLVRDRMRAVLGDHPEAEGILRRLGRRLATSTATSYGDHFERFAEWCVAQSDQPSPLPAATATVLRWLESDVCAGDRVAAGSLQPYLSAINRVHEDCELDKPALGHLVTGYRRGLAHEQREAGRGIGAVRVYLPPPVAERALRSALHMTRADAPALDARGRRLLRAHVSTVFTFSFFARGATGVSLQCRDVRRSAAGVTITLRSEKGKDAHAQARTLTLPPGAFPELTELLDRWEFVRGYTSDTHSFYSLRGERRTWPSTQVDTWLRECLAHLSVAPPAGERWSGHSLRKGAASGAAAIDVSLSKICWCGGWSIQSRAVHDYIDPTCPATPACRLFFGWLRGS